MLFGCVVSKIGAFQAEELSRLHELEMDKNRIEQERIRAHQLKMAAIDDARRQAEQSKLELQRLRAQEQQMGTRARVCVCVSKGR